MDKKSFILYNDQSVLFNELSDVQAGQLIKQLFSFANKTNGDKPSDPVMRMAYLSITGTMYRDNIKYEEKCKINQHNGSKGGRPKKGPDFTNDDFDTS